MSTRSRPPRPISSCAKRDASRIAAAFAAGIVAVFLLGARTLEGGIQRAATPRPKIVLITVDTLRADRIGCYGYNRLKTPNIDRLAAEGIRFTNAIAQVPLTLPSHCSIFTGTYPLFHGVHDQTDHLSEKKTTLAEILKARGFTTAAFVSSFVLNSQFGLNQGFDHYDDALDRSPDGSGDEVKRRGDQTLSPALAWLETFGARDFFVWIHLYDPHVPYSPPEPFRTRYAERPYDGEVAFVDSLMGRLIGFLEKKGWYSQTLLIFTSDHGEDLGDHGENTHGFFVYDSTLRVPLIIKAPGRSGGAVIHTQVQSVDIAPTILQVLSLPPVREMQGRGMLSLAMQKQAATAPGLGETFYPFLHFGWSPLRFLRTERFKYIEAPRPELYDLREDPRETRNLAEIRRPVAQELRKQLLERLRPRGEAPVSNGPVDTATLEKLKSLGYVGSAARRTLSGASDYRKLPDPKEKLGVYTRLQDALLDKQNNRLRQAIGKFQQLTEQDPNLIDAYIETGLCYKRLGQYASAVEQFKKALERDPANTVATYNLAHSYALAGKIEEAQVGFHRTLELNPRESRAHVGLGIAHQMQGKLEPAVEEYRRALEINPSESRALSNLGAALLAQGNTDQAITSLQRALEISPRNAQTHNTLGAALLMKNNLAEAVARLRQAVELDPNYADAYANLGLSQIKRGDLEEGIADLKKALQIKPSSGYVHHLLGQAYAARGMQQAAEAEFQAATKLGYR